MRVLLFTTFALVAVIYLVIWARESRRMRDAGGRGGRRERRRSRWVDLTIGFATNFLDTLGVGSFATTTAAFRATKSVADELIPGTLNVGHTLPTVTEAFIYIVLVQIDLSTLAVLIAAAASGASLGAGIVVGWDRRRVQMAMGGALLTAVTLMLLGQVGWLPAGGRALGLHGGRLVIGAVGNFILGALMTVGIGLYAPCMILVSLLGLNPLAAFPIMMGSCAVLMPIASVRFIGEGRYDRRAAAALAVGGIPAVLIAAFIVKSLPLTIVRWLVMVVVTYTALALLRAATESQVSTDTAVAAAHGLNAEA